MKRSLLLTVFYISCLLSYAQSAVSLYNKAAEYEAKKDYIQAFECYLKSAEQGLKEGQYATGVCYYNGMGVSKDYNRAFEWLLKSAEQGLKEGQFWTGYCYYHGMGVSKDYNRAFEWLLKSAEQGYKEGQYMTARCYFFGNGVTKDHNRAFEWFLKSAEQGHEEGQYMAAIQYEMGWSGAPQDLSKALDLYFKSAEQGCHLSQKRLGQIYYKGEGVEVDTTLGSKYLRKAANNGDNEAKLLLEDVLYPIPSKKVINDNTFAIVICNNRCQNFSPMPLDRSIFKEYLQKTLGLKDKQMKVLNNPSLGDMVVAFDWIKNVTEAYNGEAKVIVYYTGPGISDESTGEAFILPKDADALDPLSGYSVNELCETFGEMPAKSIVVILDACFNGTRNDGTMIASARGVAIKSKPATPKGNMVLMTASSKDETAYAVADYYRGIFTTKFLQKLKETEGEARLGEIFDFASKEVSKNIILEKGKPQTPQVIASPQLGDNWKEWKLNE